MTDLGTAGAARRPATAGQVVARREGGAIGTGAGEDVVHVWRVADAVYLIQPLGHRKFLAELVPAAVQFLETGGDEGAFRVVPGTLANPIACVDRWPAAGSRHAEVRPPCVVT